MLVAQARSQLMNEVVDFVTDVPLCCGLFQIVVGFLVFLETYPPSISSAGADDDSAVSGRAAQREGWAFALEKSMCNNAR